MNEQQLIVRTENLAEVNNLLSQGFKVLSMLTADLILLTGTSAQVVRIANSAANADQAQG
jgi:hypothetical protein